MNPVLLKPQSDIGSQIIVQGKVFGEAQGARLPGAEAAADGRGAGFLGARWARAPIWSSSRARARRPRSICGSRDIANMGFATRADVPVVLVGDIDRGGVIASIAGTHLILPEEDRRMIVGYLINKFRGDVSLFDDGHRGDREIHRLALLRRRAVAEGGGAAAVGGFGGAGTAGVGREAAR